MSICQSVCISNLHYFYLCVILSACLFINVSACFAQYRLVYVKPQTKENGKPHAFDVLYLSLDVSNSLNYSSPVFNNCWSPDKRNVITQVSSSILVNENPRRTTTFGIVNNVHLKTMGNLSVHGYI